MCPEGHDYNLGPVTYTVPLSVTPATPALPFRSRPVRSALSALTLPSSLPSPSPVSHFPCPPQSQALSSSIPTTSPLAGRPAPHEHAPSHASILAVRSHGLTPSDRSPPVCLASLGLCHSRFVSRILPSAPAVMPLHLCSLAGLPLHPQLCANSDLSDRQLRLHLHTSFVRRFVIPAIPFHSSGVPPSGFGCTTEPGTREPRQDDNPAFTRFSKVHKPSLGNSCATTSVRTGGKAYRLARGERLCTSQSRARRFCSSCNRSQNPEPCGPSQPSGGPPPEFERRFLP